MRVLFLSEYYPYDLPIEVAGVFQRMRMLLDALTGLGTVDILFFTPEGVDTSPSGSRRFEAKLFAHWGLRANVFFRQQQPSPPRFFLSRVPFWARCVASGAVAYYSRRLNLNNSHPPSVEALERCLDRRPDLILACRLGTMAPLLMTRRLLPPVFFDLDDAEHVRALRLAGNVGSLLSRAEACATAPILLWSEWRAMQLARATFVCSERDLHRFRHFPRHGHRAVVPNTLPMPAPEPPACEPSLLFIGFYGYPSNVEAADFLVREIWPQVHAQQPGARLLIAGPEPERIPALAGRPAGVEVLGFVEDLPALYRRTRVVCCPIRVAGGTRIKILEAASYGRPIVSTRVGAEGLDLRDGEEILLRDDPQSFAAACVELLKDTASAERLGTAARAAMARRYDRAATVRRIRDLITAGLS